MTETDDSLSADLIYGAKVIGAFIGADARQANYMLETKRLPGFKIGNKWVARKSTIKEHIEKLESGRAAK